MKDTIYRDDAVALIIKAIHGTDNKEIQNYLMDGLRKQMWALPSAENSNAKTQNSNQETQNSNGDLIYRADAIEELDKYFEHIKIIDKRGLKRIEPISRDVKGIVDALPSAEEKYDLDELPYFDYETWGG